MNIREDTGCSYCQSLGQNDNEPFNLVHIFYTINPYEGNEYGVEYIYSKSDIDHKFVKFLDKVRDNYRLYGFSKHYERSPTGKLHLHGMLAFNSRYTGNTILDFISRVGHELYGKKWNKHRIACDTKLADNCLDIYKYINKQNIYVPEHVTLKYSNFAKTLIVTPTTTWSPFVGL